VPVRVMESSDPDVLTLLTWRVIVPPVEDVLDLDVILTVGRVRARGVMDRVAGAVAPSVVMKNVVRSARAPEPSSA